jgi:hypothetical protein
LAKNTVENIFANLLSQNLKFDDKEFLMRYAESTSNFGQDGESNGIWNIDFEDIQLLLNKKVSELVIIQHVTFCSRS